jgi:HSP20 family protein
MCQSFFQINGDGLSSTLTMAQGMVTSFIKAVKLSQHHHFIDRVSDMPRFSGRKPYHREIFSRQVGEIKSLLHALEMRDGLDDALNRPLMDIYEAGDRVILEFDLPGFQLEDISLKVCGLTLVLEAFKPREQNDGCFICVERSFGHFHHAVPIPGNVDPCSIRAEYRLGVLRVMCQKTGDRQVPIKEITIE